jgi:hypothetical protein
MLHKAQVTRNWKLNEVWWSAKGSNLYMTQFGSDKSVVISYVLRTRRVHFLCTAVLYYSLNFREKRVLKHSIGFFRSVRWYL